MEEENALNSICIWLPQHLTHATDVQTVSSTHTHTNTHTLQCSVTGKSGISLYNVLKEDQLCFSKLEIVILLGNKGPVSVLALLAHVALLAEH